MTWYEHRRRWLLFHKTSLHKPTVNEFLSSSSLLFLFIAVKVSRRRQRHERCYPKPVLLNSSSRVARLRSSWALVRTYAISSAASQPQPSSNYWPFADATRCAMRHRAVSRSPWIRSGGRAGAALFGPPNKLLEKN